MQTSALSSRNIRATLYQRLRTKGGAAFTLVELLVVIAIIALLAALLFPALNKTRQKAEGIYCISNTRQLAVGWTLYSDDHEGRLPYNLGGNGLTRAAAPRTNLNWVNNIMTWEVKNPEDSDNTNLTTITAASLGPYTKSTDIYRCPGDHVLSDAQRNAGWSARIRSYSMNAMIGDAGELTLTGTNQNNPGYVQFFKMAGIPRPSTIFVFLDEHPDSINDGYFINQGDYHRWLDLPASYHNGAASFSFADGHGEIHRWLSPLTKPPSRPEAVKLPMYVADGERGDLYWTTERMSVEASVSNGGP
jgi:prepilin-type N-terminal cleavage/methylation domain-containing protein/prepilin-type processing-associated H-X9-DG protein